MSKPIESYGLIGDCETAALVGLDGSIDWLCWPRFDSDSTFAALLGTPEHGRWLIAPAGGASASGRRYRQGTLILETRFAADGGEVTLIDFMPPRGDNSDIVRLVCGARGRLAMQMELVIRFGYGRVVPWVRKIQDESGTALLAVAGPDMVVLHTTAAMRGEDMHRGFMSPAIVAGQAGSSVRFFPADRIPTTCPSRCGRLQGAGHGSRAVLPPMCCSKGEHIAPR